MDNIFVVFLAVLIVILIPAALILYRALKARASEEDTARRQRLDYQPTAKPIPVGPPVPISRQAKKPVPASAPAPAPVAEVDLFEGCSDLQQSLVALVKKYSLDSFTIATSDGLVFASSGSDTAQEDAAGFSLAGGIRESAGVALFGMEHKGSGLTGIVRSAGIITGEQQKRIESDTKDILNRWI